MVKLEKEQASFSEVVVSRKGSCRQKDIYTKRKKAMKHHEGYGLVKYSILQ